MRPRILLTVILTVLFVMLGGCSVNSNCPTCGTTTGGAYAVIDVIPVPEHNNTGTPGGPFNSFDISWVAANPSGSGDNMDYVSDRIGIAVQVIDTDENLAINSIAGQNGVSGAGNNASPCVATIPPLVSVNGNFTRFGCRNPPFQLPSGFGPSGNFGGFTGAQCCAARGQGVNPMSCPNGVVVTNDGKTLFVGNGSASLVVFDLTASPPTVIADIPTGVSGDYDGPQGLAPCLVSWQGEAGSSAFCGDDRGDEISYDSTDQILAIINGDPGLPFITFIDVSGIVARTSNCLPIDKTTPYGPVALPIGAPNAGQSTSILPSTSAFNPPSCILGQIYYDGVAPGPAAVVDSANGPCPDPSNPTALSGVSGAFHTPAGVNYTIPCQHGPVLDNNTGSYSLCNPTPQPGANCIAAISPAGLGAHAWDPNTGFFLLSNSNSTGNLTVGSVDVINPKAVLAGGVVGPAVINSYPMLDCMPTGVTPGPGDNFLVGCADHDGEAFPANEYIITSTTSGTASCAMPPAPSVNCAVVTETGGVDETWYNPGDNRYYLAARDMLPGPVMGVIDAGTNLWLANLPVNTNAHSIAVDPNNNRVFMPQQAGAICGTQAGAGCIDVIAQQ